ncbi:hypothetical protein ACFE04_005479 [Oxalis oulophora]
MTRKDGASSSSAPVHDNTNNRPTTRSLSQGQVEAQLAPPPIPPGHAGYRRSGICECGSLMIVFRRCGSIMIVFRKCVMLQKNVETGRKGKKKVIAPKKSKKGLDANTDQ